MILYSHFRIDFFLITGNSEVLAAHVGDAVYHAQNIREPRCLDESDDADHQRKGDAKADEQAAARTCPKQNGW